METQISRQIRINRAFLPNAYVFCASPLCNLEEIRLRQDVFVEVATNPDVLNDLLDFSGSSAFPVKES
jgi:hypothetical protein